MPKESNVYFKKLIKDDSILKIYENISKNVKGNIGLKVHFGEKNNKYFIKPNLMKSLVRQLDATFIETNVLYVSDRRYTDSHLKLAKEHGFTYAPIDILDDAGEVHYKVDGNHFNKVKLGKNIEKYDTIISLAHFKGHALSGFGGAIKNIGMGLAAIAGKMDQHASTIPIFKPSKCVECGTCVPECPGNAISLSPLKIDSKKCIGCGKCIGICPEKAFRVPWGSTKSNRFMERLVEYAKGVMQYINVVFINVLMNISKDCDCMSHAHEPFVEDIGILASEDIVAIENASYDLVDKHLDSDDAFKEVNNVKARKQIEYAHSLGMGNKEYNLIEV